MYFTHSLAGAIAIKPIIDKVEKDFTEKEKIVLWFIGITASVLPDFDLLYMFLSKSSNHRHFVTHGVTLYLIMFIIAYLLRFIQERKEFGRKFFKILSTVFITGVLTHLVLDTLVGGIALLSPFSFKTFGFNMDIKRSGVNWLVEYLKSRYMLLELLVASLFFYVFRKKRYTASKVFSFLYLVIALASFVLISITMF
ncbi:MAG: metal-dependent hydrolase [Patescibacteria group bacterium]